MSMGLCVTVCVLCECVCVSKCAMVCVRLGVYA